MTNRRSFIAGLAAFSASAAHSSLPFESEAALFGRGLVLGPGPRGRRDDDRLGGPAVRWDPAIQKWRMWYYGRHVGFPTGVAPAFGSGSILTAVSDDGVQWTREDGPLEGGAVMVTSDDASAFDTAHIATGDVIRHGDRWLMAYFGGNDEVPSDTPPTYLETGYRMRIGLAESPDGLNWRRIEGNARGGATIDVLDEDIYSAFPGLVETDDGLLIHYTSVDKRGRYWRSRLARAADGLRFEPLGDLEWTTRPALFESGGVITRDVVRNPLETGGRYLMLYTAKDGRAETNERRSISAAVSDDAIRWRRLYDAPIFTVGIEGAWDRAGVAVPRLTTTDDRWLLHYYGWSDETFAGHPQRGIGAAVAPPGDLRGFLRAASPIA